MTTSIFTDFEDRTMVRKGVDLEFLFQQDVDLMMLLAGCLKCGGAVVPERESVDLEWTERGAVDPERTERVAVVPERGEPRMKTGTTGLSKRALKIREGERRDVAWREPRC